MIRQNIEWALVLDSRINITDLEVDKRGERIYVHGKVRNLGDKLQIEKSLAEMGFRNFSTRKVKIIPKEINDKIIKNSVENAIETHCEIGMNDCGVFVENGVVTLRGSASTLNEKVIAGQIASHAKGVRRVKNQIKVARPPVSTKPDLVVKPNIRFRLNQHHMGSDINISVNNGIVTLVGTVTKYNHEERVLEVARTTPGVIKVINKIENQGVNPNTPPAF